jgi:hypothetical protein
MPVQRKYKDADGTSRYVHMDDRSISGSAGDVALVRSVSGALDFGASATGNVFDAVPSSQQGKFSSDISCEGFESVVLHIETSKSGAAVKIRPWIKDATGNYSPLTKLTVDVVNVANNTNVPSLKSGYYACVPLEFATRGAKFVKFELTDHSTGNVSVWACAR